MERDEQGRPVVTEEQYEEMKTNLKEKYQYDEMSDEDKQKFDDMYDRSVTIKKDTTTEEGEDPGDEPPGIERERELSGSQEPDKRAEKYEEIKKEYNYEQMSPEQQRQFDNAFQKDNEEAEKNDEKDKGDKAEGGRSR